MMTQEINDNNFDDNIDNEIRACMNLNSLKNFILYAGAGSGKTRSLVSAIKHTSEKDGKQFLLKGQKIAVITYTNAACNEIKHRLEFDPLVDVQTIHSFTWSLVKGFDTDIRKWLACKINEDIAALDTLIAKGRASKTQTERTRSREAKRKRLEILPSIKKFTYSPTGDNRTRDALNHSEVISMTADFLSTKYGLRKLLTSRYPILLIDESQDTNHALMDAFLFTSLNHSNFCLGLFGDSMQRIYNDGKLNLDKSIPDSWAKPVKQMNHRCPRRVIELINNIREPVDGIRQKARADKMSGCIRLFLLPHNVHDKFAAETTIAARMAKITEDPLWNDEDAVKTLTLEHQMAAKRLGFDDFFTMLYSVDRLKTGLLDGSLPALKFFTSNIIPLVEAASAGNRFKTAAIVRNSSPLLRPEFLKSAGIDQVKMIGKAKEAVESLNALFFNQNNPTLLSVLQNIHASGLFAIPESLEILLNSDIEQEAEYNFENENDETSAWRKALNCSFDQIKKYNLYINGQSKFDTHQGVKGLEFPRVMIIIADDEANGFLFSYDKLLGVKEFSKTDHSNSAEGRETTFDRTLRLFYVICSRAEESLAIVHYSEDPAAAKKTVLDRGWFTENEVEILN